VLLNIQCPEGIMVSSYSRSRFCNEWSSYANRPKYYRSLYLQFDYFLL